MCSSRKSHSSEVWCTHLRGWAGWGEVGVGSTLQGRVQLLSSGIAASVAAAWTGLLVLSCMFLQHKFMVAAPYNTPVLGDCPTCLPVFGDCLRVAAKLQVSKAVVCRQGKAVTKASHKCRQAGLQK